MERELEIYLKNAIDIEDPEYSKEYQLKVALEELEEIFDIYNNKENLQNT